VTGKRPRNLTPPLTEEDRALFHQAMAGVRPLRGPRRATLCTPRPWPEPRKQDDDSEGRTVDDLSDHIAWLDSLADDEALTFVRNGVTRQVLRNLRRAHWPIQAEIDLHGYTSDEARRQLVTFLDESRASRLRCVRIIHGKGLCSPNREPVLKFKTANWLLQRADVLAFCQAGPREGGGGALLVLLKGAARNI
jgi:DNA-nicking Smr family endonuclease